MVYAVNLRSMNSSLRAAWVVVGFGACGLLAVNGQGYQTYNNDESNARLQQSINNFIQAAQQAVRDHQAEQARITAERRAANEAYIERQNEREARAEEFREQQRRIQEEISSGNARRARQQREAEDQASAQLAAADDARRRAEADRQAREEARRASELAQRNEALNTVRTKTAEAVRAGRFDAAQSALAAWRTASAGDAEFVRLADTLEAEVREAAAEHARIKESDALLGSFLGGEQENRRVNAPVDRGEGSEEPGAGARPPAPEPDLLGSFL
jgi:phage-related minor tail protein